MRRLSEDRREWFWRAERKRRRDRSGGRLESQRDEPATPVRGRPASRRALRAGISASRAQVPRDRHAPKGSQFTAIQLRFEGALDLVSRPDETRRQLRQVRNIALGTFRHRRPVYFDFSAITQIDAASLLYLVANIDILKSRGVRLRGNYPVGQEALRSLYDAHFEEYIGILPKIKANKTDAPSLKIISGRINDPEKWVPLYHFLQSATSLSAQEADTLYTALGELVENVIQHAFEDKRDARWYAVALRPTDSASARVVVLDLGIGIHNSIGRNVYDKLRSKMGYVTGAIMLAALRAIGEDAAEEDEGVLLGLLNGLVTDDQRCLRLATQGLRTRTAGRERGTGLDGLRQEVLRSKKGALHIASGRAMITYSSDSDQGPALPLPPISGTFVCLEFSGSTSEARK